MEEKLYPLSSFLAFNPCQASTFTIQHSAISLQPSAIYHYTFHNSHFKFGKRLCI